MWVRMVSHLLKIVEIDIEQDLNIVKVVFNSILSDGFDRFQINRLWSDFDFLDVSHKRNGPVNSW